MIDTLIDSQRNDGPIKPWMVYSRLRVICRHLVPGRQEDAHEFLRYLIEAMEKSYLLRFKNSKEFDQYSKETTPLNQILGGYLRSAVRCLSCNHVSTTFQHFEDILLDIRKSSTIDEALEVYFARERLEDMGYKCESCKKKVSATKQFYLERTPPVLCIQLKRFSVGGSKLNKHITIRTKLDLSSYAFKKINDNTLTYKLVSMVTHLGSSQHCGHYTAIGLTDVGGYYQFDDSNVRPISIQNVLNTNAYILFYELENITTSYQLNNNNSTPPTNTVTSATAVSSTATSNNNSSNNINGHSIVSTTNNCSTNFNQLRQINSNSNNNNGNSTMTIKSGFIGPQLPPSHLNNNNNNNSTSATTTASASSSSSSAAASSTTTTVNTTSGANNNNSKLVVNSNYVSQQHQSPSKLITNGNNKMNGASPMNGIKLNKNGHMNGVNGGKTTLTNGVILNGVKKSTETLPNMPKLQMDTENEKILSPPSILLNQSKVTAVTATSNGIKSSIVTSKLNGVIPKIRSLVPYDSNDDSDSSQSDDDCPAVVETKNGQWQVSPVVAVPTTTVTSTIPTPLIQKSNGLNNGNGVGGGKKKNFVVIQGNPKLQQIKQQKQQNSNNTVNQLLEMGQKLTNGNNITTWNGQKSNLEKTVSGFFLLSEIF